MTSFLHRVFAGRSPQAQRGSIAITTALSLFLLLGFMGLALDFGRLFVLKGELQTAVDSCALAAAAELDTRPDALSRARSAGQTAGNLNRVDFQSATWGGKGGIVASDLSFLDGDRTVTFDAVKARYARCEHRQAGVNLWLLHALGSAVAATPEQAGLQDVWAFAVATRANAQSSCVLPVGFITGTGSGANYAYGVEIGSWMPVLTARPDRGQIGWLDIDETKNGHGAAEQASALRQCETRANAPLTFATPTPGERATLRTAWNSFFGFYKNSEKNNLSAVLPDFTGYSYTQATHPGQHVYQDYKSRSTDREAYQYPLGNGSGGISAMTQAELQQYGSSRRLVTVPVFNDSVGPVVGFACMLMVHPMLKTNQSEQLDTSLELVGDASSLTSPCATSGLPGGSAGPLVPALVR